MVRTETWVIYFATLQRVTLHGTLSEIVLEMRAFPYHGEEQRGMPSGSTPVRVVSETPSTLSFLRAYLPPV